MLLFTTIVTINFPLFQEKLLGGIALTVSILGPATYISYNIKNYNMK